MVLEKKIEKGEKLGALWHIYKAEDATRVLIHELMHSSCADNHENGIDIVEAETEAKSNA